MRTLDNDEINKIKERLSHTDGAVDSINDDEPLFEELNIKGYPNFFNFQFPTELVKSKFSKSPILLLPIITYLNRELKIINNFKNAFIKEHFDNFDLAEQIRFFNLIAESSFKFIDKIDSNRQNLSDTKEITTLLKETIDKLTYLGFACSEDHAKSIRVIKIHLDNGKVKKIPLDDSNSDNLTILSFKDFSFRLEHLLNNAAFNGYYNKINNIDIDMESRGIYHRVFALLAFALTLEINITSGSLKYSNKKDHIISSLILDNLKDKTKFDSTNGYDKLLINIIINNVHRIFELMAKNFFNSIFKDKHNLILLLRKHFPQSMKKAKGSKLIEPELSFKNTIENIIDPETNDSIDIIIEDSSVDDILILFYHLHELKLPCLSVEEQFNQAKMQVFLRRFIASGQFSL